jgi:hypothetical protein
MNIQQNFRSTATGFLSLFLFYAAGSRDSFSQTGGGYINYGQIEGEPLTVTTHPLDVNQSPNWTPVRNVGMGMTQTADGRFSNGMLSNPALLSERANRATAFGVQAAFPKATFDATSYIKKNIGQFRDGDFLKLLGEGFSDYYSAETAEQQALAVRKINRALDFPNELLDKIVGRGESPGTHGFQAVPFIQVQQGRWGVSVFGRGQIGFAVEPGETTTRLLSLHIPANTEDLSTETLYQLAEIVGTLFDENGDISQNALPRAFAVSTIDVAGVIGRSFSLGPALDGGASLKIINRRFSTKIIDPENLDRVLSEARSELKHTATGVTVDLGIAYRSPSNGTRLGFSVLNVFPVKTITSTTEMSFSMPAGAYFVDDGTGRPAVGSLDESGVFTPDPAGDTLVVVENRQITARLPFRLKAPLLANAGLSRPIRPNWDVSVDWVDILSKDDTYNSTAERIRLGTEYRIIRRQAELALRGGVAQKRLAIGAGLKTRIVQIDVAYARDSFLEKNAIFSQIQIGW